MSSSIPELSVDTLMLERILEGTAVGETVPYGVLSKAIGRDVRNGSRHIMQSARERLLKREPKETRIVFEAVEGIGLKRLDSVGCVAVGDFTIGKIRRASKRGVLKVACADYDKLPKEDKIRFNAHLSLLGALHQATSPAQVKRLNAAVEKATDKLPSAEVLTLFTK